MTTPSHLHPHSLAELKGVSLRCHRVVDGLLHGLHRSPHHGSSVEFSEHKEYSPGDDLRYIDWKAYGRLDKHYVKRFEHESNLSAWCLIDASGSMGYLGSSAGLSKLDYAKVLAGSLAYILIKQQDAFGIVTYREKPKDTLLPAARTGHLNRVFALLDGVKAEGGSDVPAVVRQIGERARKRGINFILSDFLSDPAHDFAAFRQLATRNGQMVAFHLVDPDEAEFPFDSMTLFEGMETKQRLLAEPQLIRKAYLKRFHAHCAHVKKCSLDSRITYIRVDTSRPPHEILMSFLAHWNRG